MKLWQKEQDQVCGPRALRCLCRQRTLPLVTCAPFELIMLLLASAPVQTAQRLRLLTLHYEEPQDNCPLPYG